MQAICVTAESRRCAACNASGNATSELRSCGQQDRNSDMLRLQPSKAKNSDPSVLGARNKRKKQFPNLVLQSGCVKCWRKSRCECPTIHLKSQAAQWHIASRPRLNRVDRWKCTDVILLQLNAEKFSVRDQAPLRPSRRFNDLAHGQCQEPRLGQTT